MPRVLLVDDDIAEISAVKRVLARAGHQAVLATNGSDALAALSRASPAVLVVAATCESGEALRRLAADGAAAALPLLVLGETASAPAGAAQLARPVDPAQLADRLAAAIAAPPPAAGAPAAGPAGSRGRRPTDRRAAADALRARAEELRRGAVTGAFPAAPAAATSPQSRETSVSLPEDEGVDAPAAASPPERSPGAVAAPEPPPAPDGSALADVVADADAALAELEAPAAAPTRARLELEQDPGLEAILRRAEEAEARARRGDVRRAAGGEAVRAAEDRARRAAEASADDRARAERDAREHADRQLARLRREIEEERRASGARARSAGPPPTPPPAPSEVEAPAPAPPSAGAPAAAAPAEPAGRDSEEAQLRAAIQSARDEMEALRRRSGAEEEQLRAAIQSARAEMEALRKRSDEEARRRAEAEAEVARLGREAERRAEAERTAAEAARPAPLEPPADPSPDLRGPVERDWGGDRAPAADPEPDAAQASIRRRVAAMREQPPPAVALAPAAAPEPPRPARPPPAELRAGTLAELPAPRLLVLAARAELSGRIDVDGEASRSLFFQRGRVVGATSSAPGERVEEVALRLGLVTRDQHRLVSSAAAPLSTRRAAVMLLERGFLKPAELAPLVRRRTEEVVFGVFGDAGARFRWSAAEVPPDESTALERSALQLAVEGVRRRWLAPELDGILGGDATLLAPVAGGPAPADLGLSPDERRALALADGLRTVDEILAASPLDPLSTRQVLAAVVLAGSLAVRTFQGGRPAAAASAAIDLARVRDKLEQVRRADYFTILGVGRLCTPHEVRDAFERLRAEFDPRRYQGLREDGLEARLDEIQRVVADARDVLADDRLRAEYLRGLGDDVR